MATVALFGCALAGFVIASYFALAAYGCEGARNLILSHGCHHGRDACQRVLDHPDGRLLGIPNAVPGGIYYLFVMAFAVGLLPGSWRMPLRLASVAAVVAAVYLSYALLVKLRTPCLLCFAAHGLNLVVALLLLTR